MKKSATATGISDNSLTPVIQLLLEMGKNLRKRQAGKAVMSDAEIQKIMEDELAKHMLKNPINPLIGMPGMAFCSVY